MESTGDHIMDLYNVDTVTGYVLDRLVGVVRYSYGKYEVHPRDTDDIDVEQPNTFVSASGSLTMEGLDASLLTADDKTAIKVKFNEATDPAPGHSPRPPNQSPNHSPNLSPNHSPNCLPNHTLSPSVKIGLATVIDGVTEDMVTQLLVVDTSTRRRRQLLGTAASVSFTLTADTTNSAFSSEQELADAEASGKNY
jgi:hypothetical protein